jgi:flagellar secretion chaperone FliS
MRPAGYGSYAKIAAAVEKKEDILLLLLDTVSMDLRKARTGIEENSPKLRGESISRALSILTELDCALDREGGGDLAENLSGLYRFMMDRLTIANAGNDPAALGDASRVLDNLHEAFREAVRAQREDQRPEASKPFEKDGKDAEPLTGGFSIAV